MYHLRRLLTAYFILINILSGRLHGSSNIDTILQVIPGSVNLSCLYARTNASPPDGSLQNLWKKDILQLKIRIDQSSQNYINAVWVLITPKKGLLILAQDEVSKDMTLLYYPSFERGNKILTVDSKAARTIGQFAAATYTSIPAPVMTVDGQTLVLSGEAVIKDEKKMVLIPYQYAPLANTYHSAPGKISMPSSTEMSHLTISKEGTIVAITQDKFISFDVQHEVNPTQEQAITHINIKNKEEISSLFKVEIETTKKTVRLGRCEIIENEKKINCNFYEIPLKEFYKGVLTSSKVMDAISIDLNLFQSLRKLRDVKISFTAWKNKYEIWYENNHDEVIKITFEEYNDVAKGIIISSMIIALILTLYYAKRKPSEKNTNKGNANSRRTRRLKMSHTK